MSSFSSVQLFRLLCHLSLWLFFDKSILHFKAASAKNWVLLRRGTIKGLSYIQWVRWWIHKKYSILIRVFGNFFYICSEFDQRESFHSSSYCLCSSSYFFCWLYMLSCLQIGINVNILAPLQNVGGKESSATTPLLTERRIIRLELCGTISHAWMGLVF